MEKAEIRETIAKRAAKEIKRFIVEIVYVKKKNVT